MTTASSTDLPLFAFARRSDPATSRMAANSLSVTPLEAHVVGALLAYPDGLITHEIADITRMALVTVSPRMKPLAEKGIIEDSGKKRPGPSNRLSIIWIMKRKPK